MNMEEPHGPIIYPYICENSHNFDILGSAVAQKVAKTDKSGTPNDLMAFKPLLIDFSSSKT